MSAGIGALLQVEPGSGPVDLSALDPSSTPGTDAGMSAATAELDEVGPQLADLQERLYAHGRTGGERRMLLVLQG